MFVKRCAAFDQMSSESNRKISVIPTSNDVGQSYLTAHAQIIPV